MCVCDISCDVSLDEPHARARTDDKIALATHHASKGEASGSDLHAAAGIVSRWFMREVGLQTREGVT